MSTTDSAPKPIIDWQKQYAIELKSTHWLQLQSTGKIRLLQLSFDDASRQQKAEDFNLSGFLHALMASGIYHELMLLHNTTSWRDMHGPFLASNLRPSDFEQISAADFLQEIDEILHQDRWQSPPPESTKIEQVQQTAQMLSKWQMLLRLSKCDEFNHEHHSNNFKNYEHEWAHALLAFHEFLAIDPVTKRAALAMFLYE